MPRLPHILSLAAIAVLPSAPVQARPLRTAQAPPANAAVQARAAVMERFTARMGRLDALMGRDRPVRARSADAEQ